MDMTLADPCKQLRVNGVYAYVQELGIKYAPAAVKKLLQAIRAIHMKANSEIM
jgi:hypothetical protein